MSNWPVWPGQASWDAGSGMDAAPTSKQHKAPSRLRVAQDNSRRESVLGGLVETAKLALNACVVGGSWAVYLSMYKRYPAEM